MRKKLIIAFIISTLIHLTVLYNLKLKLATFEKNNKENVVEISLSAPLATPPKKEKKISTTKPKIKKVKQKTKLQPKPKPKSKPPQKKKTKTHLKSQKQKSFKPKKIHPPISTKPQNKKQIVETPKEKISTAQKTISSPPSPIQSPLKTAPSKIQPTSQLPKPNVTSTSIKENKREKEEYLKLIIAELEKHKKYPLIARRLGIEGTVTVEFIVKKDGSLKYVKIVSSSGNSILDSAAEKLVKACHFPPLPADFKEDSFKVKIPIHYKLQ
ncbi:outer membrane transport energization protein TonB [Desulfurobacterium pacificum]|uniref:Outer membrane transport energization protein TonB n=1 Tax=Desulfurobacterium pacificum TaxID=240166 RepID=A0ABY1NTF2_9BACT|nr:energy transducer TonB [Desulfurobacterium pacificum]SMP17688.1 outer membrane transport energization protein TonB [Desulfurobacterium pacificum]